MRIRLSLAIVIVCCCLVSTVAAQNGADPLTKKVDQLFATWDKPESPGAAIAVIKDGIVVYKRGYGSANLEYNVPITPQTVFHVASVSKQFTAFAIALLASQGKLSLDDDIRKHLPEVPDFGKKITVRHLIHHTSGLRDQWTLLGMAGWRLDDVITKEHIMKMVRYQRELNFDPGAENLYSNTGYTLLAVIVERVSGQSFREYTEANIFKPLGMTNTHFHDDHEEIV
ncbi:MAG TPA: serine hydrolase, partial [Pyrinomonadaceae bacterium]|nr:serine hydrolase [Pyrinomonadaceae bacterium]